MARTITLTEPTTYEVIACTNCGVDVAAPDGFLDRRRKDGRTFYCLNGHGMSWSESEADKLRKSLAAEQAARAALVDQLAAAERERKRHAARAKNGVCPCCNRSFVQLARHMKTQHPRYADAS